MRTFITVTAVGCAILLSGCFYFGKDNFEDVARKSPETWDTRDCLTIILGAAQSNYADDIHNPGIKIVAIPYYPSVIAAIERHAHLLGPLQYAPFTYNHSEETYRRRLDSMLAIEAGVFMDWSQAKYVDAHGKYLQDPTQVDFLMLYISLSNVHWPGVPPDQVPDIANLENNMYLLNDRNELLRPRYVFGKQHTRLTTEEMLHVTFILKNDSSHFLANSRTMRLVIEGFSDPLVFEFPLSRMR
jgi:hypothetical protein